MQRVAFHNGNTFRALELNTVGITWDPAGGQGYEVVRDRDALAMHDAGGYALYGRQVSGGAQCLADFSIREDAQEIARALSRVWNLPLHDDSFDPNPAALPAEPVLDPLAVAQCAAYIVKGFIAHPGYTENLQHLSDEVGEVEVFDSISAFALNVERAWLRVDQESWGGVCPYDVTEPFGEWLGDYVQRHDHLPTSTEADEQIALLVNQCLRT